MGNTSAREIDLPDLLITIVHVPNAVAYRSQSDGLADEGAADQDLATAEMDQALLLHLAHLIAGRVLDRRQRGGEWPRARPGARSRRCLRERLVWPEQIVHGAPGIEGALDIRQALPAPGPQHFQLERAMGAFLLALRLRMIGPPVRDGHAQPNEPCGEPGGLMERVAPPGRAVVHQHAVREAVPLHHGRELGPNGLPLLIGARSETEIEAGVIVQDGKRVAAPFGRRERTLEVHLPEAVRARFFEARPVSAGGPLRWEQAIAAQNAGDRRRRRWAGEAVVPQQMVQLASAPGGMLAAQRAGGGGQSQPDRRPAHGAAICSRSSG